MWRISVGPCAIADGTHKVTREEVFVALSGTAEMHLDGHSLTLAINL
ncbi:MAG: hypothetical protein ABI702_15215 [Burkholderiales bacterium]